MQSLNSAATQARDIRTFFDALTKSARNGTMPSSHPLSRLLLGKLVNLIQSIVPKLATNESFAQPCVN